MAEEKIRTIIVRQENRKRAVFIFKFLLLIGLMYVNFYYKEWVDEQEILSNIIKGLLFYLTANLLISLVRIVLVYLLMRQKQLGDKPNNVVLAINRIATLLNVAVLIAAAFLLLELNWETFFTSFSLVAVATVILTKDYISNTVNGIIIMVSDHISLNDYIKVGNHTGKVVDITLSSVHLLDDAEHMVMIPNNTVFASNVVNYSRNPFRCVEVNFDIKPESVHDLTVLEHQLIETLNSYKAPVKKNSYELRVLHIFMDRISLQFRFTLQNPDIEKEKDLEFQLLKVVAEIVTSQSNNKNIPSSAESSKSLS